MLEIPLLLEIIGTVGFPIAVCIAMGWFIFKIYKASEKREEQLREELKQNSEINGKFAEIIGKYSIEITEIKADIKDIKEDVIAITEHLPQQ